MFWVSIGLLALLLLMWLSTLYGVLSAKDLPVEYTLDGTEAIDALPAPMSLSIIIPARNEEANIEACLRAAFAVEWDGDLQFVVIDDKSTDKTGEILAGLAEEDSRLTVVKGVPLPEGWMGKSAALFRAQTFATGDWLLFVDADVRLEPTGPARLIGRLVSQGGEMASCLGRLTVESFWERVVQTRIGAMIAGANPLHEVNDPEHERAMANGQCLLFKRECYDRLGGHETIKSSVLDDVDFAKLAKKEEVNYRLYWGLGVFRCRMYTGLGEIWEGWTKNLFPALEYSLVATVIITLLIFASSLLPFVLLAKNLVLLALGHPVHWGILGLEIAIIAVIFATDFLGHRKNQYSGSLFWTFPLGICVIIALFWNSAWRITSGKGAVWKGRVVEAGRPPKT